MHIGARLLEENLQTDFEPQIYLNERFDSRVHVQK